MKKVFKVLVVLFFLIIVFYFAISYYAQFQYDHPQVEETINKSVPKGFLENRIAELKLIDEEVWFRALSSIPPEPEGALFKEAEIFYQYPDDHGWMKFVILEILDEGIIVKYESGFDHRSFGTNKVTIDRGTFKLLWK